MTRQPLSPRTGRALALVFGGLTLLWLQPAAQAESWKTHGRDVALELGRSSQDLLVCDQAISRAAECTPGLRADRPFGRADTIGLSGPCRASHKLVVRD